MAQNQIRWKRGDYIKLGRAVSEFNKKVKELEQAQGDLGLPELIDYKSLKSNIYTRSELNRQLNLLRKIKEPSMQELTTKTEEPMLEWEYSQLKGLARTTVRRAKQEIQTIQAEEPEVKTLMGKARVQELEASIRSIEKFAEATGKKLENIKTRLQWFGTSDASMKHAIVFRENYYKQMEKYKDFEGYDDLIEFLDGISNPINFYDTLKDSGDLIADLFYQSVQTYTQARFSAFVQQVTGEEPKTKKEKSAYTRNQNLYKEFKKE